MRMLEMMFNPREIRQRLGLNQQEFWTRIGVTQSGGSRYESGRAMPKPVRELLRLVHVEQVDLSQVKRVDFGGGLFGWEATSEIVDRSTGDTRKYFWPPDEKGVLTPFSAKSALGDASALADAERNAPPGAGAVVGIEVRCTAASCTEAAGEASVKVTYANGQTTESGSGWTQAAPAPAGPPAPSPRWWPEWRSLSGRAGRRSTSSRSWVRSWPSASKAISTA